jgi:transposase
VGKIRGERLASELRGHDLGRVIVAAIDGGKKSHKALVANGLGDIITDTFEFTNDLAGATIFAGNVDLAAKEVGAFKVMVGVEPTGHYCENLVSYLLEQGRDVRQVNTMAVDREREAGLTWCKTDEIDLCAIGQLILNGKSNQLTRVPALYYNLKQAARARRSSVRRNTMLASQIHAYMDRLFPGLLKGEIFRDPLGAAGRAFMVRFGSARAVRRAGVSRVERWLASHVGFSSPHEKAEELVGLANGALVLPETQEEVLRQAVCYRLKEYDLLEEQIRNWDIRLAEYLIDTPGIWLLAIRRIGVVSAAEYVAEMGPLTQYHDSGNIISRSGLVPRETQSSTMGYTGGVTKLGSPRLRYIVGVIGNNLVIDNRYFRQFFEHLVVGRGKDERLAKTAVSCKFVRVSWAMMTLRGAFAAPTWCGDHLREDIEMKLRDFLTEAGAGQSYRQALGPRLRKVLEAGGYRGRAQPADRRPPRVRARAADREPPLAQGPVLLAAVLPTVLQELAPASRTEVGMA